MNKRKNKQQKNHEKRNSFQDRFMPSLLGKLKAMIDVLGNAMFHKDSIIKYLTAKLAKNICQISTTLKHLKGGYILI